MPPYPRLPEQGLQSHQPESRKACRPKREIVRHSGVPAEGAGRPGAGLAQERGRKGLL